MTRRRKQFKLPSRSSSRTSDAARLRTPSPDPPFFPLFFLSPPPSPSKTTSRRLAPGPLRLRPLPALRLRPRGHRPPLHRRVRLLDGLRHVCRRGCGPHGPQEGGADLRRGLLAGLLHQALEQLLGAARRQAALRGRDVATLLGVRVVARRRALPPRVRRGPARGDICQGRVHRQRARRHRRCGDYLLF